MRPLSVILRRIQCGLPVTDEEADAAMEHIEKHKHRQNRLISICLAIVIALNLAFITYMIFKRLL